MPAVTVKLAPNCALLEPGCWSAVAGSSCVEPFLNSVFEKLHLHPRLLGSPVALSVQLKLPNEVTPVGHCRLVPSQVISTLGLGLLTNPQSAVQTFVMPIVVTEVVVSADALLATPTNPVATNTTAAAARPIRFPMPMIF